MQEPHAPGPKAEFPRSIANSFTNGSGQGENYSDGRKRIHRKEMDRKVAKKEKVLLEKEETRDLKDG